MLRKSTLLFLLFLPLFAYAEIKQKSVLHRCDTGGYKSEIKIQTITSGYKVNNNLSTSTLNHKGKVSYAGEYVLGMTALQKVTVIDLDGEVWQDKQTGGECFAPKISVKLIYEPLDVFVGSEFFPGTCIYNEVFEHEMQHVRLYQNSYPVVENTIRQLLEKRFAGKAIYAQSGRARALISEEIDQLWRPLIKSELAKVEIDQSAIDSDEEVTRLSWSCLGEIRNMFGGHRRR